jgi:hypothetical protein
MLVRIGSVYPLVKLSVKLAFQFFRRNFHVVLFLLNKYVAPPTVLADNLVRIKSELSNLTRGERGLTLGHATEYSGERGLTLDHATECSWDLVQVYQKLIRCQIRGMRLSG